MGSRNHMKSEKLKLYLTKDNSVNIILSILIVGLTFTMLYLSPLRLDDWAWGRSVGIERLKTLSADYNGRFFSNIVTPILLHIPSVLRVVLELAVLGGVGYYLYRTVKNAYLFYLSLILLILIPAEMFNQTVTWVSGFTNYVLPVLSVLFLYDLCINQILEGKRLSVPATCIICLIVVLSQGIMETTTIYIFFLLMITLFIYYDRYKKISVSCALFIIFSIIGVLLMSSNGGYMKAINGEDYKEIHISGGLINSLSYAWETFVINIVVKWMTYGYMSVITAFTMIPFSLFVTKRFRRLNAVISTLFFAVFFYCLIEKAWLDDRRAGRTVFAVLSILFCLYIIYLLLNSVLTRKEKQNGFICAFSQIVLVGPLVFVYPAPERCFLQPYIHWILLFCFMIRHIAENIEIKSFADRFKAKFSVSVMGMLTRVLITAVLILAIAGQSIAYKTYKLRDEAIAKGIESGSEEIIIPEVPNYIQYCIGANVFDFDDYWMENYKLYYGIPNEVKVTFIDYYEYIENYT